MEFGQRHATLAPPLPRRRLGVAAVTLGVALAGAAVLYSHTFSAYLCEPGRLCSRPEIGPVTPAWVDPTVLVLCLLGVVAAFGALTARLRIAIAAVILGVTLGAAAAVYAEYGAAFHWCADGGALVRNGNTFTLSPCVQHVMYFRADWITPTALGLVALGVVVAAGGLFASRRGKGQRLR